MKSEVKALLEKAERSLRSANRLYSDEDYDFAVSRAYYAMFYCAEALLLTKNLTFSRHSAVISSFGKEFVKSGIMDKDMQRYLMDAFDARQIGDYDFVMCPTKEECEDTLKSAKIFIQKTKEYLKLKKNGGKNHKT